ncbi:MULTISPECIES: major capsid protein [Actinomadura]|uniref:Major capsid protein n=1 Tax=Actinomadura yumaensis TaxID=111807 RepID=A0ABW2CWC6_9ACTN|nr:major capsid protein [Actinomadura sp. J1-007]MWK39578.1 phage capsid protein [Actinomadura sp. J1-007]
MYLNTDFIAPAELTGYVRQALADLEANQFTLSRFLPSEAIDDLDYRFTRGGEGLTEAASFRAYDAESPIGSRPGLTRVSGELPPISRKVRLGEYDRLRQRRADQQVRDAILDDSERMTRSVAARVELARGEALYSGKLVINENGVIATVDFGRAPGHTVAPAILWTAANAVPLTDLMAWRDTYVATNGSEPGVMLTSRRVMALLMRNAEMRNLVFPGGSQQPDIVTQTSLAAVLDAFGLPPIEVYDAQVRVGATATRVIPDDRVLLLPDPGSVDGDQLGRTLWGTTAESLEPDFAVSGDEPGIVAGSYSTKDPVAVWTKAAGIALPVLANPDLTFCADVA